MSSLVHPPPRVLPGGADFTPDATRNIPVLPSSVPSSRPSSGEPMVGTPSSSAAAGSVPAVHTSPNSDRAGANKINGTANSGLPNNNGPNQAIGAVAAAQQPKVVQTAFIHKLYNMLEDPSIQHLISWSSTNDSFVMSPTSEFSKVLSQYFKHTNISSFVRQLNMYGFHKVSDVFHTGSPESALWEFKHGNGSFKRGDLIGLREIKRRASRHALIHRDSFSAHKTTVSQPGTPGESVPDATEARLMNLEHSLYDMHNRLARTEENYASLSSRFQGMSESLYKCYQLNQSITHFLLALIPDRESPLIRDVSNIQKELERQLELVRTIEHPHESLRQQYLPSVPVDTGPPLSPRQVPQDDNRRPSTSVLDSSRPNMIRPPVLSRLAVSPRRYGSIGAANNSPNYNRPQPPPVNPQQPPVRHPLAVVSSPPGPNLARRHTSADIRQHGWPPSGVSPIPTAAGSTSSSGPWPPSPRRAPNSTDQQLREALAQYEMGAPKRLQDHSRHATPPPPMELSPSGENGWAIGGPKFPRQDYSLPATRRSSMASNVYSLLNSAETVERPDEDSPLSEDRKRKRLE